MSDCECLATCPFFNDKMAEMPAMAEMYKRNYCRGDSCTCARHMVFRGGRPGRCARRTCTLTSRIVPPSSLAQAAR